MKARWILAVLTALFLAPSAWAANRVVDAAGNVYSVGVVALDGQRSPDATALSYSVLRASGAAETGLVSPTQDLTADLEPSLVLAPGADGPFIIWTRHDGAGEQIAFSRYSGNAWGEMKFLTSGGGDRVHPSAGVDARGIAYVVWVEPAGGGSVIFATFDPATGNLLTSPRDLFKELVRHSPALWLTSNRPPQPVMGKPTDAEPGILPEGGNDTPAIPPCTATQTTNCKKDSATTGLVVGPSCSLAAAAIVRSRELWIGLLEGGGVLEYYRGMIPPGAPDGYVDLLLQALLDEHCQS